MGASGELGHAGFQLIEENFDRLELAVRSVATMDNTKARPGGRPHLCAREVACPA
jgi:hypothetical protein